MDSLKALDPERPMREAECSRASVMSASEVPAQPVDATQALNLSAGVSNCKVSRGVELTRDFVRIGLRVHRQVGAFRKVLYQQAIGVLVRVAPTTAAAQKKRTGMVVLPCRSP